MKVFIADDSAAFRKSIIALISDLQIIERIGQAGNVQDAINNIQEFGPDVVILDIRMPGGNGIDVLRKIGKTNQLPVFIMLTNYACSRYREKCMNAGADFFLDKSNEFEKLAGILSDISVRIQAAQEGKGHAC
jgi:DNA-binding NarL/FixJ family response regulator